MGKRPSRYWLLHVCLFAALSYTAPLSAWNWRLTGSVESDVLFPEEDREIGTERYNSRILNNTYVDLALRSNYLEAGTRLEYLAYPLPGFEKDFRGWGFPHLYVTGHIGGVELTAGDLYDQFGSGLIFRTYESRPLGIDNALRGGRLILRMPLGVTMKLLGGTQRRYWKHNTGIIVGGDIEMNVDQWLPLLREDDTRLTLGFSGVNKHEPATGAPTTLRIDTDAEGFPQLNLYTLQVPEDVQAFDMRATLSRGSWSALAEYALKSHDPSADNGYTFRHGKALLLSTSWSKAGKSALIQLKRSEDMAFRSSRGMTGLSSYINHLPAFTMQHTYALAALYPYATQYAKGEWALQGEFAYTIRKGSPLGGRYGTQLALHASHIRSLGQEDGSNEGGIGTNGIATTFIPGDNVYYQDINVTMSKRISKGTKINLMYMNQLYNKTVVEGEGGMIHSHIMVAEGRFTLNRRMTLRCEGQYLHTKQDQGDWWYTLAELTLLPHWMFSLSDMYNGHVPVHGENGTVVEGRTRPVHYPRMGITLTGGAHRLQVSYGRTRAGFNCAGGVCRYVPATKGWMLSYNYVF